MTNKSGQVVGVKEIFDPDTGDYDGCYYGGETTDKGKEIQDTGLTCPLQRCVDPTQAIQSTKLLGCDVNDINTYSGMKNIPFSNLNKLCKDGRIAVTANFSKLPNSPVARITSNASQYTEIDVYLPKGTKTFITNDPLGFYALALSKVFQNFTFLDPTWHDVGGFKDHNNNRIQGFGATSSDYGNGSYWYHYRYAIQIREPQYSDLRIGNITRDASKVPYYLGNVTKTLLAAYLSGGYYRPVNLFNKTDLEDILDITIPCTAQQNENLRIHSTISCSQDNWNWGCLWKYFDIGVAFFGSSLVQKNPWPIWGTCFKKGSTRSDNADNPFPGGTAKHVLTGCECVNDSGDYSYVSPNDLDKCESTCVDYTCDDDGFYPDYKGKYSSRSGPGNALSSTYIHSPSLVGGTIINTSKNPNYFTAVNSTNRYDLKFFKFNDNGGIDVSDSPLAKATAAIINHVAGNETLKVSAGYAKDDPVKYNVSVDSTQYYLCFNRTGGDNWQCGQWMAEYMIFVVGYTNGPANVNCQKGKARWWFLSLPLNFSCYSCVLYNVEETYKVTRNTHEHPDVINQTVISFHMNRIKENYENPAGLKSTYLPVPGMNSTWRYDPKGRIKTRHVIYWCEGGTNVDNPSFNLILRREKCKEVVVSDDMRGYIYGRLGIHET